MCLARLVHPCGLPPTYSHQHLVDEFEGVTGADGCHVQFIPPGITWLPALSLLRVRRVAHVQHGCRVHPHLCVPPLQFEHWITPTSWKKQPSRIINVAARSCDKIPIPFGQTRNCRRCQLCCHASEPSPRTTTIRSGSSLLCGPSRCPSKRSGQACRTHALLGWRLEMNQSVDHSAFCVETPHDPIEVPGIGVFITSPDSPRQQVRNLDKA